MSMHQPVDTRELDKHARKVMKLGLIYLGRFNSNADHNGANRDLLQALGDYRAALEEMVLAEPEVE